MFYNIFTILYSNPKIAAILPTQGFNFEFAYLPFKYQSTDNICETIKINTHSESLSVNQESC